MNEWQTVQQMLEGLERDKNNELRESIIHNLRSKGWTKQEAEDEADYRVGRRISPPPIRNNS